MRNVHKVPEQCEPARMKLRSKITLLVKRSWPVSRVLSRTAIHLGRPSPNASSNLPESGAGHAKGFLFGLAPGGVYTAGPVTRDAVRSYRTISPLPVWDGRYIFCCTGRRLTPPRCYLAPCPVEPGLSSISRRTPQLPGQLHYPAYLMNLEITISPH